mmetsp:Transcript_27171/g.65951  ORF Transcript_27171/g.65951 Transcript_27171/m.65951 type:complete len:221 (+) Transcript_27171:98-760(+)
MSTPTTTSKMDKKEIETWNRQVVRLEHTNAYTILDDQLYLSHYTPAQDESLLQRDGISHVLNTAMELETQSFSSVNIMHLKLYDSPDQKLPFHEAAEFIQSALSGGGKCLVHCNAGQSRSASLVIYYIMTLGHHHYLKDSYDYVKARKPNIGPNFGFVAQLEEEEKRLFRNSVGTMDMTEYKADSLLEILDGSGKTKEQVMAVLKQTSGNAHVALDMLLD